MKKYLLTFMIIVISLLLIACNNGSKEVTHEEVFDSILIGYEPGDSSIHVTKNITLPATTSFEGVTLTWISANENIVSSSGKVNRPRDKDVSVLLILEVVINGEKDEKNFLLTVIARTGSEPLEYTVTFNSNGGTNVSSQTVNENNLLDEPTPPTKDGFKFEGWYKDNDLLVKWNFNSDVVDQDLTLYANWISDDITTYTVSFNSNGGSLVSDKNVIENSLASEPSNPTKDGYTFEGWYKDSDLLVKWNFNSDLVNENLTLYANWLKEVVKYTVTFDTDGGSSILPVLVDENTKVSLPTAPIKIEHTFDGWYKDNNFDVLWDFENDLVTNDLTLYAKWKPVPKVYTVTFETNGGNEVLNLEVEENHLFDKPDDPIRDNYIFDGWYQDENLTNKWDFLEDLVTSNLTLYASWYPEDEELGLTTYKVFYETNYTLKYPYDVVVSGGLLKSLPKPERFDYEFLGWFKDSDFNEEWDLLNDQVTEDITLYANFKQLPPKLGTPFGGLGHQPRPVAHIHIPAYEGLNGEDGGFQGIMIVFTNLTTNEVFKWGIEIGYNQGKDVYYNEVDLAKDGIVLTGGSYELNYYAIGNKTTTRDSDFSPNVITFEVAQTKLTEPKLTIDKDNLELTWQNVAHATSYEVYIDDILQTENTSPFDLSQLIEPKTYLIKVVAHADNYQSSEKTINYVVENPEAPKLDNPSNLINDEFNLTWDNVLNASRYSIRINDIIKESNTNSFDLELFNLSSVEVDVFVKALGDGVNYQDSKETKVTITLPDTLKPKLNPMAEGDQNGNIKGYNNGYYNLIAHLGHPPFSQEDWSGEFKIVVKEDNVILGETTIKNGDFLHQPNNSNDFYGKILENGKTYIVEISLIAKEGSGHRDSDPVAINFTFIY